MVVCCSLGAFAKYPGPETTVVFVTSMLLVGFILWLNPSRKLEVTREEFEKLQAQTAEQNDSLKGLKLKLGFQRI
jgi:hypothetical protein